MARTWGQTAENKSFHFEHSGLVFLFRNSHRRSGAQECYGHRASKHSSERVFFRVPCLLHYLWKWNVDEGTQFRAHGLLQQQVFQRATDNLERIQSIEYQFGCHPCCGTSQGICHCSLYDFQIRCFNPYTLCTAMISAMHQRCNYWGTRFFGGHINAVPFFPGICLNECPKE